MNSVLKGYLQLMRPANLPTAAADIVAGLAIAGYYSIDLFFKETNGYLLMMASVFLYAGGVVLNDVFDLAIDKVERPERPIPSGLIALNKAKLFGFLLLFIGVLLPFFVQPICGYIAFGLAILILIYDSFSKHSAFLGPLNMGLCRGCNLLLGMSVFGSFLNIEYVIIPILYIAAITLVSQGEVFGKNKINIFFAAVLYAIVIGLLLFFDDTITEGFNSSAYFFLAIFVLAIGIPLFKAYRVNTPQNVKKAVKAGVISIILLDAVIAVNFSNLSIGLFVILFLPLSIFLAKTFAVT